MDTESQQFAETWVYLADGQSMCALFNEQVGWLMYLRKSGDPGFSSRNPEYSGPDDAVIEYQLNNGQRDQHPAAWALPANEVWRALQFFQTHRQPPNWMHWHNDSGDGVIIGNAT